MKNKLCVITGANSGIGFETTKELAAQGAFVVMVCRNEEKAEAARKAIINEIPDAGLAIVLCDFASMDDIRSAAGDISAQYEKIDILINNHGFIAKEYDTTVDGLEQTFGVNHIGYFLFTNLLLPQVKAAGKARIINVASTAHRRGEFDPDNIQLKTGYDNWKAYGNSKLFNILFTTQLAKKLEGTEVTANCLHPGVIASNFGQSSTWLVRVFYKFAGPLMKDNRQGAETTIYLATSPEVEDVNGAYFSNKKVATPSKIARDEEAAKKLWVISEEICSK